MEESCPIGQGTASSKDFFQYSSVLSRVAQEQLFSILKNIYANVGSTPSSIQGGYPIVEYIDDKHPRGVEEAKAVFDKLRPTLDCDLHIPPHWDEQKEWIRPLWSSYSHTHTQKEARRWCHPWKLVQFDHTQKWKKEDTSTLDPIHSFLCQGYIRPSDFCTQGDRRSHAQQLILTPLQVRCYNIEPDIDHLYHPSYQQILLSYVGDFLADTHQCTLFPRYYWSGQVNLQGEKISKCCVLVTEGVSYSMADFWKELHALNQLTPRHVMADICQVVWNCYKFYSVCQGQCGESLTVHSLRSKRLPSPGPNLRFQGPTPETTLTVPTYGNEWKLTDLRFVRYTFKGVRMVPRLGKDYTLNHQEDLKVFAQSALEVLSTCWSSGTSTTTTTDPQKTYVIQMLTSWLQVQPNAILDHLCARETNPTDRLLYERFHRQPAIQMIVPETQLTYFTPLFQHRLVSKPKEEQYKSNSKNSNYNNMNNMNNLDKEMKAMSPIFLYE